MKKIILAAGLMAIAISPVYASDSNLTGTTWQVVSQSPSLQALTLSALKALDLWDENNEDEMILPDEIYFTITDDLLIWETASVNDDEDSDAFFQMPYHVEGNQFIIDGPTHVNPQDDEGQFYPQYYTFSEDGDHLTLTTDSMPVFGDQMLTYDLVKED